MTGLVHDVEDFVSCLFRRGQMARFGRIRMVPSVIASHLILYIIRLIIDLGRSFLLFTKKKPQFHLMTIRSFTLLKTTPPTLGRHDF